MSYVPSTTVKNGRTLNLANVEWQVTGTDPVGEALVPSSYQAVATYSAKATYQAATGYVTTAEYTGEVTHEGVESITYVLTYLGTKVGVAHVLSNVGGFFAANWLVLIVGAAMGAAVIFGIVYGAYTLFWMPETLPRYYDENHVCNFAQGAFHMHIPGVYYNNRNWLHVAQSNAGVVRGKYAPDTALHGSGGRV